MSQGAMATKLGRAGLAARTLIVRVDPTPITFAERRAVLRTLRQHGEIEVFKKLDVSIETSPVA
jgi:hypothetical protein